MYLRRRLVGPALRGGPLPVFGVAVSAVGHALICGAFLLLAGIWSQWSASKVYVVNLVPAVSAVGAPTGRSMAPSLPPRPIVSEAQRRTSEPTAKEPSAAPRLPDPAPGQARPGSRPPALPRPGEKESPALTAASDRRPTAAPPAPRLERARPAAEPPAAVAPIPLGHPGGSPAGLASLALDVSDFPFTYYLRQIQQKVSEKWVPPARSAEPGQRVVVLFEIARDGQVRTPKVEKSSGNAWYDQSALRAVMDATPFPPLPQEFPAQSLRVHFGFDFVRDRS